MGVDLADQPVTWARGEAEAGPTQCTQAVRRVALSATGLHRATELAEVDDNRHAGGAGSRGLGGAIGRVAKPITWP